VLDQHTLELERRDPIIRGLEDIVGAPDVGDVALVVAGGDVARVVITAGGGGCAALSGIVIAGHQPARAV
jgi:SpoU rRNA methylase family enzyme